MARRRVATAVAGLVGWFGWSGHAAVAGMPSITLTDVVWLRFEAISFFGMLFLLATWGVQALWNGLRADFPRLPRLSYRRALGLVAIWGLLFLLVLTMISGARDLMTPGAWKKVGLTYKLAEPALEPEPVRDTEPARRVALGRLKALLWQDAASHDGQLPASREQAGFPDEVWLVPGPAAIHYIYVTGQRVDTGPFPVVYEPSLFGPDSLVLSADGAIQQRNFAAILRAIHPGGAP